MPPSAHLVKVRGAQLLSIFAALLVWESLVRFGVVSSLFLSPPSAVFRNLIEIASDPKFSLALLSTMRVVVLAWVLSALVGVSVGILIGTIKFLGEALEPYVIAVFALPKIILVPIFWFIFGFSILYRTSFGFIHGVFPILIITLFAVRGVDLSLIKVARTIGANRGQIYTKVTLPSLVPQIIAGLRVSFLSSFLGVLLSEMFVQTDGFGSLIVNYSNNFQATHLYVAVVFAALVGMAASLVLLQVEKYLLRWRKT